MSEHPPAVEIEVDRHDATFLIRVKGELDMAGCPELERALSEAEQDVAAHIVLDVRELAFIDVRGLQAIMAASRRSAENGKRLLLTHGEGQVASMFRFAGIGGTLPSVDPP